MDAQFLQSWKGALLIAAVVTLGITGYKAAFGPDIATRIAEMRMRGIFPNGEPSAEIMNRPIVGGPVVTPFGLSLAEFLDAFPDVTQTFEPVDERNFVLRLTGTDPLTRQQQEWAFHFRLVDGPQDVALASVFDGPAVHVLNMAFNGAIASGFDLVTLLNAAAGAAQKARTGF
ncbi:hypothetical protein [Aureimonas ureilytica]|uniref:hypothetical protein n=1 Tax=Aureimonas ureilytica TaxID=401562 RepID=UPI00036E7C57|nr:hypothetical protein [Aureimonas ureilytica]